MKNSWKHHGRRRGRTLLLSVLVAGLLFGLATMIRAIIDTLRRHRDYLAGKNKGESKPECLTIPPHLYRRPDPLIYDQYYLIGQGLAVTWDNPDIHLELGGVPVSSSSLTPSTEYDVVARIWNGSVNAPAVNMPVRFSYLDFGIGTVSVFIGQTTVDLPVKGAPGHPAFAHMKWTTPSTPGHYCLQVELIWADDANPANNLGQENTDVKPLNSPHAAFTFPVRNDTARVQALRLEVDAYSIPPQRSCDPKDVADSPKMTQIEFEEHRRDALARHQSSQFPVPEGWRVEADPHDLRLAPGEERTVTVDIMAPDSFSGRQALNVNAFDGANLTGGVTLYVER